MTNLFKREKEDISELRLGFEECYNKEIKSISNEVDVLDGYEPIKLIFVGRKNPSGRVTQYKFELPDDIKEKIKSQLIAQYGDNISIAIAGAIITITE